jgi:ribonuclease HI
MSDLVAYVDGSSHGNPGRSGVGVVIESPGGEKTRIAKSIVHRDNNVAEYVALLEALQHAIAVNAGRLRVYSDSEIVVKQMTGEYACRSPRLHSLNWTCRKLAVRLISRSSTSPRAQPRGPTSWPTTQRESARNRETENTCRSLRPRIAVQFEHHQNGTSQSVHQQRWEKERRVRPKPFASPTAPSSSPTISK